MAASKFPQITGAAPGAPPIRPGPSHHRGLVDLESTIWII
jgi:hypothetical protein